MPPNILLIVLDSVRAKNTSLHGHVNDTTPFLRSFAAEDATTYKQARAPGTTSITSHASILTGFHVNKHKVASADVKLKKDTTVFESLRDKYGYDTAVFSENVWITEVDIGLDRGFETVVGPQDIPFTDAINPREFVSKEGRGQYLSYIKACVRDERPLRGLANGVFTKVSRDNQRLLPKVVNVSTPGKIYADRFLEWMPTDAPWAACINLMDAHMPYRPLPAFDKWGDDTLGEIEKTAPDKWKLLCGDGRWWRQEARTALYDGAIRQADHYVERIVEELKSRDVYEDTLIVITSDHGEGFGETSRIRPVRIAGHNIWTHEAVLHVPLVVKAPGQNEPEVVEAAASLVKFPTVAVSAVEDEVASDGFVPEKPVIASNHRIMLDESLRKRAREECDDISPFEGISRVVYENGSPITKRITWKNKEASIEIRDAQTSYKVSDDGGDVVREVFESMEAADVREDAAGMDAVEAATEERLEKLGYL